MKQSTYFTVFGSIAFGSLAAGLIGAILSERKERKRKLGSSFSDLYEDNAPTDRELAEEYERVCGRFDIID